MPPLRQKSARRLTSDRIALLCALVLLGGAARNRLALPKPADANSYHEQVAAVARAIPMQVGEWIAEDVPVPSESVSQLRPNVIISRRYRNSSSGAVTTVLLVQCRDVRDLAPHYPPVCYPGRGLMLAAHTVVPLRIDHHNINASRYTFESTNYQRGGVLHVDNFMILPDGGFQSDMQGMERRIGADQRYFGAAQIQILHGDSASEPEQTAVSQEILQSYEPLIDAISNGVRK